VAGKKQGDHLSRWAKGLQAMSCAYALSHEAYCKIVLHTLKFPHATVSGVLLGRKCV
jgi:hypothetical protein